MADVIGPVRTLAGAFHRFPKGTMCDLHPDRLAVARIQGETDSFGAELNDCCQECKDKIVNAPPHTGTCDWCNDVNVIVKDHRDFEEGLCGRVYQVCQSCCDKETKKLLENDPFDDYYD